MSVSGSGGSDKASRTNLTPVNSDGDSDEKKAKPSKVTSTSETPKTGSTPLVDLHGRRVGIRRKTTLAPSDLRAALQAASSSSSETQTAGSGQSQPEASSEPMAVPVSVSAPIPEPAPATKKTKSKLALFISQFFKKRAASTDPSPTKLEKKTADTQPSASGITKPVFALPVEPIPEPTEPPPDQPKKYFTITSSLRVKPTEPPKKEEDSGEIKLLEEEVMALRAHVASGSPLSSALQAQMQAVQQEGRSSTLPPLTPKHLLLEKLYSLASTYRRQADGTYETQTQQKLERKAAELEGEAKEILRGKKPKKP